MPLLGSARRSSGYFLTLFIALTVLIPALAVPTARERAARQLEETRGASQPSTDGTEVGPRQVPGDAGSAASRNRALERRENAALPASPSTDYLHPHWSSVGVFYSALVAPPPDKVVLEQQDDGTFNEIPLDPQRHVYAGGPQYTIYRSDYQAGSGGLGPPEPVTRYLGSQFYPAVSRDGTNLAYCSTLPVVVPPADSGTDGGTGGGTGPLQQQEPPPAPPANIAPNPLPLQLQIMPLNSDEDPPPITTVNINPRDIRSIQDKLGVEGELVVSAHRPTWSPDGQFIVFAGLAGTIAPKPAAGGGPLQQQQPAEPETIPEQTIFMPVEWDLWVVEVIPGATVLTASKLQYLSSTEPDRGYSGADPALRQANMADEFDPAYSPDGATVAFTRGRYVVSQVDFTADPKGFTESWSVGKIWLAPVRTIVSPIGLGQPRQVTFFRGARPGTTQIRDSIDFQPAWTQMQSLVFVSNREDQNGDTIPDSLSPNYSIFSLPSVVDPESDGGFPDNYHAGRNLARKETFQVPVPESFNELYPTIAKVRTVPTEVSRDIIFQAPITMAITPNSRPPFRNDIWVSSHAATPTGVFRLRDLPSVSPRLQVPGQPVKIRVPLTSWSPSIRITQVQAIIRYPDRRVYGYPGLGAQAANVAAAKVPGQVSIFTVDGNYTLALEGETGYEAVDQIPLFDDGPAGGHGDDVAGDGVYSAVWNTPTTPRDYYLDAVVFGDTIIGDPTQGGLAFDYLDNVWGFSTRPFVKENSVLLVLDYTAGQGWQQTSSGADPKRAVVALPVESYYTSRPHPTQTVPPTADEAPSPIITWGDDGWDVLGPKTPFYQLEPDTADLWRTQCRDRMPLEVLMQYAPQPVSQVTESGATRTVRAAYSCVIWASPYAGNLTVGPGTITDPEMQRSIQRFLEAGGRMALSGQDVAWALTQHNTVPNPLLTEFFKANLMDDAASDAADPAGPHARYRRQQTAARAADTRSDVLIDGPIAGALHWVVPGLPDGTLSELWISPPLGITTNPPYDTQAGLFQTDGAWNQQWLDGLGDVTFPPAADPLQTGLPSGAFQFQYSEPGVPFDDAAIRYSAVYYHDPSRDFKTVFLPYGLEALHRGYADVPNTNPRIVFSFNRAAQLMHNILCWMGQFRLSGRVVDAQVGRPIANAVVRLRSTLRRRGVNNEYPVVNSTRTDAQGRFVFEGVDSDSYLLDAEKPGFISQHSEGFSVHGLYDIEFPSLVLTQLPPGQISGQVTDAATGVAIEGARVVAHMSLPGEEAVTRTAETDAEGNYSLQQLPAGQYTVIAVASGYQPTSLPTIQVPSGRIVTQDFRLTPGGPATGDTGLVAGIVRDSTGAVVVGAQVRALQGTAEVAGSLVITDAGGLYAMGLPPGQYTIEATQGARIATRLVTVPPPPDVVVVDLVIRESTDPGGPQPGDAITIPAGLSLISLPGDFSGRDLAALMQGAGQVKAATYVNGDYVLYPSAPADSPHAGHGYWVKLDVPARVTLDGAAPPVNAEGYFERPLESGGGGWNLVGTPFGAVVSLAELRVRSNGNTLTLQEAVTAGLVRPTLWSYDAGSRNYVRADRFIPGVGYWIRALQPVTLLIPAPAGGAAQLRALPRPTEGPATTALDRARQQILNRLAEQDRLGPPRPPF